MTQLFKLLTVIMALCTVMGTATTAMAQGGAAQTTMQNQGQMNFSEAKLDAYAESAYKIAQIKGNMAPQMESAPNEQQKRQVYQAMQNRMATAIQNTDGITIQEYQTITRSAQTNPALANRIRSRFQAAQ